MENFLRPIYQERASDPNTLGILMMEKTNPNSPLTDNFDIILLIIVKEAEQEWFVKHYESASETAAMHIVKESTLMEWIDTSSSRRAVEWVINGRVVYDRNEYISNLKDKLRDFPLQKRNLRKAIEFGKLVKSYNEAKALFASKNYKDANSKVFYSLHYLARLAVVEKGYYPEVTVWNQVKNIDIEIYKLYEEFIDSSEEMEKKIQLMILAMDYVINHRAEVSAEHLLSIMRTKDEPWSYAELKMNPFVEPYTLDLSVIISYLEEKEIILPVLEETKGVGVFHRKYKISDF
ncbi:nucleotidyltransferase-like protein [Oceanobacillus sp. Castelsardo]|uniref:nucleotidyltransferase-like protein n=1 Tax=Oceanobacillus sp. Castelsardo TaxID=1851204 RepID=UPI0008383173|nr:nucleotidyltransferase-like protein [Oceanobacillus sp. Castelsardo]